MFGIRESGSSVHREVIGGLTTFMAMSYILFVQPEVLAMAGMDRGGVFMATCLSSAAACFLMGLLANYPVALAPGMGENFFFVFTLCGVAGGSFKLSWQEALALTAVVGVVFLAMSLIELRSKILTAIPASLKTGITAGIGLFITLIGLQYANVVVASPATSVTLAPMPGNYVAGLALLGLGVTGALVAYRVPGAILLGILFTTAAAWAAGQIWHVPTIAWRHPIGTPHGLEATAGGLLAGFAGLWDKLLSKDSLNVVILGFVLLFMAVFDTVGTLVGVGQRAGLMRDGRLLRAERALAADAAGTVVGAVLGTSTVTCYIESAAGVTAGARTGLATIVTGLCLLAALFFQPLVGMVGAGIPVGKALAYPTIAPALIVVGAMMMRSLRDIPWDDVTEALPAFLTMVMMPFGYSIAAGIAIGFVSYAALKLLTARPRQCPLAVYILAALFVLQYLVMPR